MKRLMGFEPTTFCMASGALNSARPGGFGSLERRPPRKFRSGPTDRRRCPPISGKGSRFCPFNEPPFSARGESRRRDRNVVWPTGADLEPIVIYQVPPTRREEGRDRASRLSRLAPRRSKDALDLAPRPTGRTSSLRCSSRRRISHSGRCTLAAPRIGTRRIRSSRHLTGCSPLCRCSTS